VKGASLTPEIATKQIAELTKFQQDNYGHHHDRSAEDVAQLIKDYYKYENVEYITDIGVADIIAELAKGYIVITPLNGQKLKNPYYFPPGPIEHMAVVIGYDEQNNEFILNDPGTKRGKSYRYAISILEDALRDYPTGYHEPIAEVNKSMIVVKPHS
jgi:RecB family endonuclease NucS